MHISSKLGDLRSQVFKNMAMMPVAMPAWYDDKINIHNHSLCLFAEAFIILLYRLCIYWPFPKESTCHALHELLGNTYGQTHTKLTHTLSPLLLLCCDKQNTHERPSDSTWPSPCHMLWGSAHTNWCCRQYCAYRWLGKGFSEGQNWYAFFAIR